MPTANRSKYFIGIDLGTGSTKAVATDELGNTVHTAQRHYPTIVRQTGYSEQDPTLIWQAFTQCISDITTAMQGPPVAVSFSAAMHSIMPVDAAGTPLANAILWADARSGAIAEKIRNSANGEDLYRHTGTAIYAMSPLCKIMWLRDNQHETFARAHKFISIKEYIWHRLFGVFEVDHSIASATGMLDIITRQWYPPALAWAGIDTALLSTPVPTATMRRYTGQALGGLDPETIFVIGASDGCCANLGGNAIRPGVAALTIGTSGAVRVGSTRPVYNYKAMTFNYLLNEQTYICGGAVNNGGAAIDWVLKAFLNIPPSGDAYDKLFTAIETVEAGSEGLIFLPYLYAERAPVWDAKSSGAFLNIKPKHQQRHFLRAALEGVCFALNDVLNAVEGSADQAVDEIVVSGGFISSPVWVQVLADITGKRLVLLQGGDSSAMGAIYLAMQALGLGLGKVQRQDEAGKHVVQPNAARHAVYKKVFEVYKDLYAVMRISMHRMHDLEL